MKTTFEVTHEDDRYVYGKRFVNDELTSTWCQAKGVGKAGNTTYVDLDPYRLNDTEEPSPEYFEACRRWPLKDPEKEAEWKTKWQR